MAHLLIAEDDSLLRQLLDAALRPHFPELVVVENGQLALDHLRRFPVDVLVTDWLMPGLDGIELIRRARAECDPAPFIIMSTVLGSPEAREHALRSGADDFLAKPSLPSAIRAAIELALRRRATSLGTPALAPAFAPSVALAPAPARLAHPLVAIAASTGGPVALHTLFDDPSVPRDCAYLVALHGPAWMHQSMVDALRRSSPLNIELAEHGSIAAPGTVYFACNDHHLLVDRELRLKFDHSPPEHFLRPAADPLFRSVAQRLGRQALAVVLTGMGSDGLAGAAEIAAVGGTVLVQDPSTAVVGGMPGAVIAAGLATEVVPLPLLARSLARHVGSRRHGASAHPPALAERRQ